ncbi:MAG TPA: carboxypeptidase-like regulatory domain-containing protein, partial [Vicinamibacterales bacterium]|nr:carboxypeptidase-like regulatory domain-containing protein [Vicinamibacterales bacterium]
LPGSTVTGRVTFEGDVPPAVTAGMELSPLPSEADYVSLADDPVATAELHDDWSFEMHGVTGPRRLTLLHAPDGWMLETIYVNGVDAADSPLWFGTKEQSISDVEVVLTNRLTEVVGMVTDEYARPFGDADVIAFPIDRRLWFPTSRFVRRADVGRNGTFSLRELPPGDYYLAAVDKRDEIEGITEIGNPDFLVALEGGAARLTVAEGLRVSALLRPVTLSSFP